MEELLFGGIRMRYHESQFRVSTDSVLAADFARVRVNGAEAGVLVAPPYDLDISAHVRPGDNLLEVTVHNTLRNHMRTLPTVYLHERSPGRE